MFRIYFSPAEDDDFYDCEVAELDELGVFDCDKPADYALEDPETHDNLRLCGEHKDAAREAGLAR